MKHKPYIVTSTSRTGNWKNEEFDYLEDAIMCADKRQKTRKYALVVLMKVNENKSETIYNECYNAKGEPILPILYIY